MQQFTRYEFKYLLNETAAAAIRARLLRFGLEPDPESMKYPRNTYPVTSLYFDTPTLDDYHDKAGGFLRRKKIRVRIYAPYLAGRSAAFFSRLNPAFSSIASPRHGGARKDGLGSDADEKNAASPPLNGDKDKKQNVTPSPKQEIWLEKKEKYEMLVSKKRVLLTLKDYDNLLYGSRLDLVKNHPLFFSLLTHGMRPTAMVRYLREPFVSPHQSHLRITFDSSLETCQTNDLRFPQPMMPIAKSAIIMEVKFSLGLPYWFRLLLSDFHLRRQSFSKYGESVEALSSFHPVPR